MFKVMSPYHSSPLMICVCFLPFICSAEVADVPQQHALVRKEVGSHESEGVSAGSSRGVLENGRPGEVRAHSQEELTRFSSADDFNTKALPHMNRKESGIENGGSLKTDGEQPSLETVERQSWMIEYIIAILVVLLVIDGIGFLKSTSESVEDRVSYFRFRHWALMLMPFCLTLLYASLVVNSFGGLEPALQHVCRGMWAYQLSSKKSTFNHVHDPSQVWRKCFRKHAADIHKEFLAFEKNYSYARAGQQYNLEPQLKWHHVPMEVWGAESPEMEQKFPVTAACLRQSPLTSLLFSILDPMSRLPPHIGETYMILRYHLTLEVPHGKDTSRKVRPLYGAVECANQARARGHVRRGETCLHSPVHLGLYDKYATHPHYHTWKKYKDFLFDDMHYHFVQNLTPKRRVVLLGDVLRHDVPWYAKVMLWFLYFIVAPFHPGVQESLRFQHSNLMSVGIGNRFLWYNGCMRLYVAIAAMFVVLGVFAVLGLMFGFLVNKMLLLTRCALMASCDRFGVKTYRRK
eukprot:TRINITY_DN19621_c0_g1_i1.p1 TRINITY_DN19621_c0_g1~~TRINITY_DN19621_c0_g1_i1.p1  ORF type:complete len:518 (-),score=63.75 TRINITY_DN19621_c0_g1_i1:95-1648(-)